MAARHRQFRNDAHAACRTQLVSGAVHGTMGAVDGGIRRGDCARVDYLLLRAELDYQGTLSDEWVERVGEEKSLAASFQSLVTNVSRGSSHNYGTTHWSSPTITVLLI